MPKAISNAADGTIALNIAPWPQAPEWLHQQLRFSVAGEDERDEIVKALANLGIVLTW